MRKGDAEASKLEALRHQVADQKRRGQDRSEGNKYSDASDASPNQFPRINAVKMEPGAGLND